MKTPILQLVLSLLFLLPMTGSYGQIKSDYDKSADFSTYKTYMFAGWEKNSDQILNEFDKKRIMDAIQSELSKRGMSLVTSDGDAAFTLFIVINEKTSTTAYTDYHTSMGYGGRWGWGMGPGMATATTTYSENDYREGTLVVDMYDTESKSLVWQGIITTVVKEKPEQREKSIPKKIGKLMREFPVDPVK